MRSLTAERNLNNAKSFETSRTETANPLPIGDWVRRSGKRCVGLGVAQKRMKKTIARLCAADASSGFYDNLFELPKPREAALPRGPAVVWCLMPMGEHRNEEMGAHSRVGRRFVDGVRAAQQIVAPCEGEQLSGSLCGKVGAVQGHRAV